MVFVEVGGVLDRHVPAGKVDELGAEADVFCVQSGFLERHDNSRFEGYDAIPGATADRACEQCSQSVTIRPSVHGPESSTATDRFCIVGGPRWAQTPSRVYTTTPRFMCLNDSGRHFPLRPPP